MRAALWRGDARDAHHLFAWHQLQPHQVCGAALLRITAMTGSTACAEWVLATFGAQLAPQDIRDAVELARALGKAACAQWLRRAAPRLRMTL